MKRGSPTRVFCLLSLVTGLAACGTIARDSSPGETLSQQPLLGKFVWHDLVTDDLAKAKRFYSGLFGWKFQETSHPAGSRPYTLITSGDNYVGGMLQLEDPDNADYSRWLGYLSVADVKAAAAATRAAGGSVVAGPVELDTVGWAAAVIDPQGAVVGLVRSRRGDPVDSRVPELGQVVWNELLAANEQSAAQFYAGLAGYGVDEIERGNGKYLILENDGLERAGVMMRPNENLQPLWLTHFAVADPAAAARRAAELGGQVLLAPSADIRHGRLAVVTDPTGAVLALHQWPET